MPCSLPDNNTFGGMSSGFRDGRSTVIEAMSTFRHLKNRRKYDLVVACLQGFSLCGELSHKESVEIDRDPTGLELLLQDGKPSQPKTGR